MKIVKNGTIGDYLDKTVGKAFDEYMGDVKWEGVIGTDGNTYVNVKGTILYLEKDVEAVVQFQVDTDKMTFEYQACEFNGIPQSDFIFYALLENIYSNTITAAPNNADRTSENQLISDRDSYMEEAASESNENVKSSIDSDTINEAYDEIVKKYGFMPISGEVDNLDYSVMDIIGDSTLELVVWGDSTREGRLAQDIYGYDNAISEAFQYIGETQIHLPEKGKDGYCICPSHGAYYEYYTVYAVYGKQIRQIHTFGWELGSSDNKEFNYRRRAVKCSSIRRR